MNYTILFLLVVGVIAATTSLLLFYLSWQERNNRAIYEEIRTTRKNTPRKKRQPYQSIPPFASEYFVVNKNMEAEAYDTKEPFFNEDIEEKYDKILSDLNWGSFTRTFLEETKKPIRKQEVDDELQFIVER